MRYGQACFEVVGHMTQDGPVCSMCLSDSDTDDPPVFLEGATETCCVECGGWLSGEEPESCAIAREQTERDREERAYAEASAKLVAEDERVARDIAQRRAWDEADMQALLEPSGRYTRKTKDE